MLFIYILLLEPGKEIIRSYEYEQVASDGKPINGSTSMFNAFDGQPKTYWGTTSAPSYVWLKFKEAYAITKYSVVCGNDLNSAPSAWTFYGSNDSTRWSTLDS